MNDENMNDKNNIAIWPSLWALTFLMVFSFATSATAQDTTADLVRTTGEEVSPRITQIDADIPEVMAFGSLLWARRLQHKHK